MRSSWLCFVLRASFPMKSGQPSRRRRRRDAVLDRTSLEQFRPIVAPSRAALRGRKARLPRRGRASTYGVGGSARFESYLERLTSSPKGSDEFRALAEQLTVNETFFSATPTTSGRLPEIVLPERIRANTREKHFASSRRMCLGREPYSLAVLVREALSDLETGT